MLALFVKIPTMYVYERSAFFRGFQILCGSYLIATPLGALKMQEWKILHGRKCRSGYMGTILQGWKCGVETSGVNEYGKQGLSYLQRHSLTSVD